MILDRAEGIDLKAMTGRLPAELTADLVTKLRDLLVGELDESPRAHADHVVPRLESVDESVVSLLRIEQSLCDDSRFDQQADRPVDGGLGHSVIRISHVEEQFLHFEHVVAVDDRVENLGSFGRVFEALGLEVSAKHRADGRHQRRKVLAW